MALLLDGGVATACDSDWGQITGIAYDANFVTHGLYAAPK